jgi:hypothetical protein
MAKKKGGPKGVRTLDLHNAIVALSQIELWALLGVVCHPLITRNGRIRHGLLYCLQPRSSRTSSAWVLIAGTFTGLAPFPARCDDGLLLPFQAVRTHQLLRWPHSSGAGGGCQELVRRARLIFRAFDKRVPVR